MLIYIICFNYIIFLFSIILYVLIIIHEDISYFFDFCDIPKLVYFVSLMAISFPGQTEKRLTNDMLYINFYLLPIMCGIVE